MKIEQVQIAIRIKKDDNVNETLKHIAAISEHINGVAVSHEPEGYVLFLATSNPKPIETAAKGAGLDFKTLVEPDLSPSLYGFPADFDIINAELGNMGVPVTGLRTGHWRNTGVQLMRSPNDKEIQEEIETKEDCRSQTEIDSGETEGTATDVTVLDSISPKTISNAIDTAYANAAIEAAKALSKLDDDDCQCVDPCVCKYVITFGPPERAGTTSMEVGVSVSGKSAGISTSVGLTTTAHAYVRWTIWRMCLSPEEYSSSDAPPPSGETGTVSIGSSEREVPCPTRHKHGKTSIDELWTWDLSWSLDNDPDRISADLNEFIANQRMELISKAVTEAGEAIDTLKVCPSHCPNGKQSLVIGVPQIRIRGGWQRYAGGVGYYHAKRFIGTIEWSVFRKCC